MARRNKKRKSVTPRSCAFCFSTEDNEILYGKFVQTAKISLHSNCLFFASALPQSDNSSVGIFGFKYSDINKELRRGTKLRCFYCKKRGATVGCCGLACKKSFHFTCGTKNGALSQHFGNFLTFCKTHKPRQVPIIFKDDLICNICKETIVNEDDDHNPIIYALCCKNGVFHKICLQTYACSAGVYFFRCPLCNSEKEFQAEMEKFGIAIPIKDASWELEDHAYEELLVQPSCSAEVCQCPKGREYRSRTWGLPSCLICGYSALHVRCGKWIGKYICSECKEIVAKVEKEKTSNSKKQQGVQCDLQKLSTMKLDDPCNASANLPIQEYHCHCMKKPDWLPEKKPLTAEEMAFYREELISVCPDSVLAIHLKRKSMEAAEKSPKKHKI